MLEYSEFSVAVDAVVVEVDEKYNFPLGALDSAVILSLIKSMISETSSVVVWVNVGGSVDDS